MSFFAGLETPETSGDQYLHLRLARSIGLRYEDAKNTDKTTLNIILSDCQKYLYRSDFLLRHADMLYFERKEVEAIEAEHPECRIVNRNPLFYTTSRNIRTVGALTLYHWEAIGGIKNERFAYKDDEKYPGEQWEMSDTLHFPGKECPMLLKARTWPDLPTEMPFYPQLTAYEIGTLFPVNPKATLDKQSIRDRGRTLLGKKKRSHTTTNSEEDPI